MSMDREAQFQHFSNYCATCNNTGEIDCYCGGDLCVCGAETEPCPDCDGGAQVDDDCYNYGPPDEERPAPTPPNTNPPPRA